MKKVSLALCPVLCLLLSACGVSTHQKEQMLNSLSAALDEAFLSQDEFVAFAPTVELGDVEKGGTMGMDCSYHGNFSCSFDSGNSRVIMHGAAGFDENGFVARLDGKLAISLISVIVDMERVSTSTSVYNLPIFYSGRK